ncbi:MAG: hypothetical protein AAF171_18290 [Cyanobacteria bacterium P01_A01_bin.116]
MDTIASFMNACSSSDARDRTPLPSHLVAHPWPTGHIFQSPGAHLTYRVVGPCCRLYDREQLPWPSCRIQWHSKEPSWRRIGRRFITDMATRKHPSYCVEIVGQSYRSDPVVMTLYTETLSAERKDWWHTKRIDTKQMDAQHLDKAQTQASATLPATTPTSLPTGAEKAHQPVAIPPLSEKCPEKESETLLQGQRVEKLGSPAFT